MFEHIVLRRAETGTPVTAGAIAEALLYYQKVHVVLDQQTLLQLVKQIGADRTRVLLRRPEISAVYCEQMLATQTVSVGVTQFHSFMAISLCGDQKQTLKSPAERLAYQLERQGISRKHAQSLSTWVISRFPQRGYDGNHFVSGGITAAAKSDVVGDPQFVREAIGRALAVAAQGYAVSGGLAFDVLDTPQGFCAFTNIDFNEINERRAKEAVPLDPISVAYLLNTMLEARADLAMAGHYGGDFVTSDVGSSIIRARYVDLMRRTGLNAESREQFFDIILPDAPSLSEAIDAGERSIDDFFCLLDKAGRFKHWLGAVNPDEGLVRAYIRDMKSDHWVQGISAKTLRYALTAGLGLIGTGTSLVSSFVDSFLVDRLLSGWRPNHFVERSLGPFVRGYR